VTQLAELLILASQGSLAYEREPDRLIAGQRGQQYDHRARCQWLPAAPPPGPSDARQLPVTVAAARRRRLRAQHPRGRLDPGPPQHWHAAGAHPPWLRALGLESNATPEFLTPPGQVRDPERNVPRAIIAGVAGVAVLYLAGTLAVLGDGAAGAARRIGRPTMRGRSQRSPVSGRRAVQRGALLNPDRHPGLRASGSWRGAARHGQGER